MIEACDRLGEKLDQLASIAQALAQAWPQERRPSGAGASGRAADGAVPTVPEALDALRVAETPREKQPGPAPENGLGQPRMSTAAPSPESAGGAAADARRLVDTFARSQGGWSEQAADLRQAVEAIMAFLENQAATAPPQSNLSDILGRLQSLEEQQKNLQSQLSVNRWGQ
jgi:hypothetical protein